MPTTHGPHFPKRNGENGEEINVLALVKGEERYVFLYKDECRSEVLRTLGRFASNPDLSFTWYDAAVLSQRIRQEETQPVDMQHLGDEDDRDSDWEIYPEA